MEALNESQSKSRSIIRKQKYKKLLDLGVIIGNEKFACFLLLRPRLFV